MQNPLAVLRRRLAAGRWCLLAIAPLALVACSDDSYLTREESLLGVSMTRVEGVVRDASTGEVLPGALVQLVDRTTNLPETRVFTNGAGWFEAQTPDAMSSTRVDVSYPGVFVTGYPVAAFSSYQLRRVDADDEVEVHLAPMALLVLNLEPLFEPGPGDRLELSINGAPPLLYTGDVPDVKYAGVRAGDVQLDWVVDGPGGRRSGTRVVDCVKFGATEVDLVF